jgi:hypothetical protein
MIVSEMPPRPDVSRQTSTIPASNVPTSTVPTSNVPTSNVPTSNVNRPLLQRYRRRNQV